ncbi:hypothetical protein [Polluticaenibacter yanchengensis]|uniref:Sensor of ECF-type sigma factor n=1 Tax=Polluticaenibacter yanchengensis TaxID=3014562 RepID=A0ABT4UMC2_9BACT|nr:hypothetical protein [Chitinophagaceae bacterium LY-5]
MKRYLYILFIAIWSLSTISVSAQEKGNRVESLRVAFITKKLDLTPDEAKGFWPVYDIYDEEMRKVMKEHREKGGSELELEEKKLNVRKKYKGDFLKVINEKKFDALIKAESEWSIMVKKELQRRRN